MMLDQVGSKAAARPGQVQGALEVDIAGPGAHNRGTQAPLASPSASKNDA